MLPAIGLNLAAQSAPALAALALGPMDAMQERSETDRCLVWTNKGIAIGESLETTIPFDERKAATFEPAEWRTEHASDGYPQVERSRTPTEGSLAIGRKSVLLVPSPGMARIRIPYELIQDVAIRYDPVSNEPRSIVVKSCNGRFDIVTFRQERPGRSDPDATTAAASELKARLAAFKDAKEN